MNQFKHMSRRARQARFGKFAATGPFLLLLVVLILGLVAGGGALILVGNAWGWTLI